MRKIIALAVRFTLVLGLAVAGIGLSAAPSSALSPGVAFGAANLPTWQTNDVVYGLATARGLVFAGGSFTQVRPPTGGSGTAQNRAGLVVLDAATGAPASCQFNVSGTARVRHIVASPDGNTVWVAGEFGNVNNVSRPRLVALDVVNCSVRAAFNAGVIGAEVYGLALQGNTLYLAGGFTTVRDQERAYFAAVNATTGALLPWTANGQSYPDAPPAKRGRAVAVSPDGSKVAIGGYFYYVNGTFSHSIALVTAADPTTGEGGALLRTYPQGFIPGNPNATSTTTEAPSGTSATHVIESGASDGRFYIGNEGIGGGVFDGRAAFSWDTGDQLWRDTCLGATQDIIEYQGTLYTASHAHDCSGSSAFAFQDGKRNYFQAQDSTTSAHLGWDPKANDGTGEGIGPRALVIATATSGAKYLWGGGEFTQINGAAQQGLTRFSTTSNSAPSSPAVSAAGVSDGTVQVRLRASVDADDSELTYNLLRGSSNTPIATTTASSVWWKRPQVTLVDPNPVANQLNTYRVSVTDGTTTVTSGSVGGRSIAVSNDYSAVIRSDGPTLLWSGARNGIFAYDTGATANSGTRLGGRMEMGVADSTDSPIPGDTASLSYDGVDDYLWNDNYAPGPSTYSVEAWIKTTTTRGGKIIGFGNGRPHTGSSATRLSSSYDRQVYMTNNGRLVFGAYNNATTTVTSGASYNDGNWHHVVATQGSGGMALYVDGARVGTNPNTVAQAYWGVWHVGGDQLNSWPNRPASNFFAGLIDEAAVYPGALSRQDVIQHYEASGRDYPTNNPPADAYGASVYNADPAFYWRLGETSGNVATDSTYFGEAPGTYNLGVTLNTPGVIAGNAAISVPGNLTGTVARSTSSSPPPVFSGQIWFRTNTTSGGKLFGFENTATGNGANYDKHLYMGNDGRLTFGTYTGASQTITSPNSYNDNAWHQAVAVLDGSGTKLYVDGALVASSGITNAETGVGYWRLGGGNLSGWPNQPTNFYFNGQLDEFSMFHRGLTAAEIGNFYGIGVADDTPPSVPAGLAANVTSNTVNLTWTASTDNSSVSGYSVYRGATADFVANGLSRIATVAGTSYADPGRPAGTWYYRVSAADPVGNTSAASDSVPAAVPDVTAPSTPAGLTATVEAGAVSLEWNSSTDDVGVTGYTIYRGATADFTADGSSQIAMISASTSYVDHLAPVGANFYKLTARDAAGNTSAASAAAEAAVPDGTPPSQPAGLTGSATGTTVDLSWSASTDNVGVTGYSVHRGTTSGFVANAASKVADVTGTTAQLTDQPAGTSFYKVVALDAAGNPSTASDPASVVVPDTVAPSVPTGLNSTVGANSVNLTWTASTDNVAVTGYTVYRGAEAGFTADEASKLADVAGASYLDQPVAPGDYFYKVVARDAAGNASAPSAAQQASVATPDTTDPSAPTGLVAVQNGTSVALTWNASTDNVGVTGYSVHRSSSAGFTPSAGNQVGTPSSNSFTNTSVAPGTWYYKVVALDAADNASDPSAEASITVVAGDPVTLRLNVVQDARVESANAGTNYGNDVQLSARATPDQMSFLDFQLPAAPAGTVLSQAVLELRTSGDPAAGSAGTHRLDLMSGSWVESTINYSNRPTTQLALLGNFTGPTTNNTAFTANVSTTALASRLGSTVVLRISSASTDNLRLWSQEAGATANRPVLRLEFVPGAGGGDTTAPSVPGGLDADVSGASVDLSWNASTDNVGVENYLVYRGTSAGFTANEASRIATVSGLTHDDNGLAPDTYYYKVRAADAAGNLSDATAAVSATVSQPAPDPVTVAVSTTVDAPVAASAPTTNYGTSTQLFARGTNTAQESFLSFNIPAAPAGMELTGAVFSYRTSGDTAAGSTDTFPVQLVTGAWDEASLNWNNRPTNAAGNLGTISGATANNTPYTTNLSPAVLAGQLGETVTIRLTGSGSDNLRLWSGEATAAYRPTITFTFEAS